MNKRAEKLSKRNYGIDLFRIFSMLCIITVHMLGHGGILDEASKAKDSRFVIIWFIYVVAYGGANCFALISGFVGYQERSSHKEIKRYLNIWFQVFFYSVVCVCIFKILHPDEITNTNIIKSFLPVTTVQY